jgi:sugar phosphate isomerase/epimerase
MRSRIDRRVFLKTTGALGAGLALAGVPGAALSAEAARCSSPAAEKLGWRLAAQLYTFRRFPFYEALDMIAALGITSVEPCFFLKLCSKRPKLTTGPDLAPEVRKEFQKALADRGVAMRNFYGNVGANEDDAKKTFEFAKEMGVETIVAEPPAEAFDMLDRLCDKYQINLGIHNHPKNPKVANYKYWDPDNVLAVCRDRSKRIGGCCDTGHWVRSGLNPVECLKKMQGRIVTMHLKDVIEAGNPSARDVPLGTGKADYAAVLAELRRQGFRGVMSIEYEHDSPKLTEDVAECVAFVEKTAGGK